SGRAGRGHRTHGRARRVPARLHLTIGRRAARVRGGQCRRRHRDAARGPHGHRARDRNRPLTSVRRRQCLFPHRHTPPPVGGHGRVWLFSTRGVRGDRAVRRGLGAQSGRRVECPPDPARRAYPAGSGHRVLLLRAGIAAPPGAHVLPVRPLQAAGGPAGRRLCNGAPARAPCVPARPPGPRAAQRVVAPGRHALGRAGGNLPRGRGRLRRAQGSHTRHEDGTRLDPRVPRAALQLRTGFSQRARRSRATLERPETGPGRGLVVAMNTPRMRFEFTLEPAWPPLAWLAKCPKGGGPVLIVHGRRVERATAWFCEAVWTGPYAAGDFDKTDLVFGSGGRLREDSAMFVSSGSTVDRLQTLETQDAVWVSNSLACLLASLDGHVDPTYPRYFRDFQSVIRGLRRYKRTLATSAGPVRLVYFSNLRWDGQCLHEVEKARPVRDFSAFGPYRDFLASSLCRLAENMAAGERAHPFALLGTISSGYDSATIAALAREAGLREVISFEHSRSGLDGTGREIAGVLG